MQIYQQYKEGVPYVFSNTTNTWYMRRIENPHKRKEQSSQISKKVENLVKRSIPGTNGKQILLLHHPNILFLQIALFLQQQLQQLEETPLLGFLKTNKPHIVSSMLWQKTAVR